MAAGCYSRLTADQIASVREVYRRYEAVRKERRDLMARLKVSRDYWRRIGNGLAGKKPKPTRQHEYDGTQVLEQAACIHCGYKPWASNTFRPCQ